MSPDRSHPDDALLRKFLVIFLFPPPLQLEDREGQIFTRLAWTEITEVPQPHWTTGHNAKKVKCVQK